MQPFDICRSHTLRKEDEKLQAELLEKQQMKDKLFEKSKFANKVANEKRKIKDSLEMLKKERKQLVSEKIVIRVSWILCRSSSPASIVF